MTDSIIREFVAEQRELLELELQADQDSAKSSNDDNEQRASHILGNLEASDVSVGLYGRSVVQLTVWSEKSQEKEPLLPAHRFTVGDEVEIRVKHKSQKRNPGGVISAVDDTFVSVALFQSKQYQGKGKSNKEEDDDEDDENGVGAPPLTLVPKSSVEVHRKMLFGLESLEKKGVDHPIAGRIIEAMFDADPSKDPPSIAAKPLQPFNSNLDKSQLDAISFALQDDRRIALIHGPPGTGKTTTVAELIHQAVHVHGMKVLVTAPSNVSVDNILERLVMPSSPSSQQKSSKGGNRKSKTQGLRAVRLGHPARIKSSILAYSLEALVQNADGTEIVADVRKELQHYLRVLSNPKSRPNEKRVAYREMKSLRKEVRTREEKVVRELISGAQVVLATTVGAANRILAKVEDGFDLVVIDEAAQALEASCWIPILRGRKVVLAGDHCQLPPTIKTKHHRAQAGLGKTMFERLMQLYGDNAHNRATPRISRMLRVQYRMHEDIANWASEAMYGGELVTHESVKRRTLSQLDSIQKVSGEDFDDDLAKTTLLLVDTAGCDMHETVNAAGSRFNQGEATIVTQHVRKLIGMGLQQSQLAIITPYNGQVELLRSMLLPDFPKLEIRSVDGFQGGERDAVVLSLVRSSDRGGKDGIGFLRDDRRQNVAVTRAKRHLAVICDSETVSQSKFISTLISWIEEHGEQRMAMEYLSDSANKDYDDDLRDAETELLRLVESSFTVPEKDKATGKASSKDDDKQLDEIKRKALMDKITSFAENGSHGQDMTLSSELSSFDRRLVHEFAEQNGLGHRSEGVDGVDRRILLTIQKKSAAHDAPKATTGTQTLQDTAVDGVKTPYEAPVVPSFSALALDDSDSDEDDPVPRSCDAAENAASGSAPAPNSILADLAKERAQRQEQREAPMAATTSKKKKNKPKGQKLGGQTKAPPKEVENLDDLDDMAFLDAQINNSQNTHGRKVGGSGKGYRTIVNGILNSSPAPRPCNTNAKATASLQSKMKEAQNARKAKTTKKKKK
jgi:ATP-dependent RNA/DNA helicase IGHMBP2